MASTEMFNYFRIRRIWSQSIEDVTMDNQQPSPAFIINLSNVGCRSQTKMAVGNFSFFEFVFLLREELLKI